MEDFEHNGVYFKANLSYPSSYKASDTPCRIRITPRDPKTGKAITKRQLRGSDSDKPAETAIFGRDIEDIRKNLFPRIADGIIAQMHLAGFFDSGQASTAPAVDLGELARTYRDAFFAFSQRERNWAPLTVKDYGYQFDKLIPHLDGINALTINDEIYTAVFESICDAARKATKVKQDDPYQEVPSAAQKRYGLLKQLISYLIEEDDIQIDCLPPDLDGKTSHLSSIMSQVDGVRSLPPDELLALCKTSPLADVISILTDTGLRIGEFTGLLFCSLGYLDGSQGRMYYLRVSGQLLPDGKRTEMPKTLPSYRIIPLCPDVGEAMYQRAMTLSAIHGDLSLQLLCGQSEGDAFITDPATMRIYRDHLSNAITDLLRNEGMLQSLYAARPFVFNIKQQNDHIYRRLTGHSERRNFCTFLYCHSGFDAPEIPKLMGHADKTRKQPSTSYGATPSEIYRMCLRRYVSQSLLHSAQPLRYQADNFKRSEVPSCALELTLPPHSSYDLIVDDMDPENELHFSGTLTAQKVRQDDFTPGPYPYALLADPDMYMVRRKSKLFS